MDVAEALQPLEVGPVGGAQAAPDEIATQRRLHEVAFDGERRARAPASASTARPYPAACRSSPLRGSTSPGSASRSKRTIRAASPEIIHFSRPATSAKPCSGEPGFDHIGTGARSNGRLSISDRKVTPSRPSRHREAEQVERRRSEVGQAHCGGGRTRRASLPRAGQLDEEGHVDVLLENVVAVFHGDAALAEALAVVGGEYDQERS